MATDYITVTLITEGGVAFQGHASTEAAARTAAYNLAQERLTARSETVPPIEDMEEKIEHITDGPEPRSI